MKNSIWYRFSSEKVSYEIPFNTIAISIKDIRPIIVNRRNMKNCPEKFDLVFSDEETPEIEMDEKDLVRPMKHLIVKRLPHYSREKTFKDEVKDPKDIILHKNNDNNLRRGELQQVKRYTEPLEKISKFLNKELLNKQFKCKICNKFDENVYNNYIISLCCKETFCLSCYNNDKEICPFCKNNLKGYVKNDAEISLVKKLLDILEQKEEEEKMLKAQALQQSIIKNNNIASGIDINQKNNDINQNIGNNSLINNTEMMGGGNLNKNILTSAQLLKQLIEGSQFFIIKSSNEENIQISKNNSVWATTPPNSIRLNQAFNKGKVILIFSVSTTQLFKGFGIMTSSSEERSSNIWVNEKNIKLAPNFSVSWLCYCELSFIKTKQLQVNKSRDCTELDQNIGYKLCDICSEQEKEELERNPQRIKIQINEQMINKINEDIINNKNQHKQKMNNNNNINKPQQVNNEINRISSAISINSSNNNIEQNVMQPAPMINPKPQIPTGYIYPPYFIFPFQRAFIQPQQKPQEINNQNPMMQMTTQVMPIQNQQEQKKPENEKTENNKKDNKSRKHRSKRRSRSKDKSRDKSRDRSRSRSRSRNKSRSSRSRRSNSSSSRSEGRSKYSKSYK